MAFGKPFKFYLINPDTGDYYKWTLAGGVTQTPVKTPLTYEPDNWKNTEIKWTRSKTYWGIFRNFSTPYTFVKDGRKIVKHIDDTQGATGKCRLVIEQLVTYDGSYVEMYSGDLDFGKYKLTRTGAIINIMEGGLVDLINSNGDTDYEIPISDIDSDQLFMDGLKLKGEMDFIGTAVMEPTTDENEVPLPLAYVQQDGDYFIGEGGTVFPGMGAGHQYYVVFTSGRDQLAHFRIQESITFSNDGVSHDPARPKIKIFIYATQEAALAGAPVNVIDTDFWVAPADLNPGDTQTYAIDQNYDYNLSAGNIVVITALFSIPSPSGSNSGSIDIADAGRLTITTEFVSEESYIRAYRYSQVWNKVIQAATENAYTGTSSFLVDASVTPDDYYGNIPWSTLVTCGDAIRGLDGPIIKTSPNEVFKNAYNIWNLGLTLNLDDGEAVLERLENILDKDTEIVDLGEVSGLEITHAVDLMGNKFQLGYNSHNSQTLNGKQEFNVGMNFSTPISNIKNALDWKCTYYTGMYDIEQVRVNISKKTTSDASQDNDTYVIESHIDLDTGVVTLQRLQNEPGNAAGGIDYPEYGYNYGISPKRNFKRKELLSNSICDKHVGEQIKFLTHERNKNFGSKLDANGNIIEIANEFIGEEILFKPSYFNFTVKIPKNLITLMKTSNGKGYMSGKFLGVRFKVFPMDIAIKPALNDVYNVIGLCHPDTDTEAFD